MWFHLYTGNHDPLGANTLYDMMEWFRAGLTDLNHDVTVGDTIARNAMNIIWENFRDNDEQIFKEHRFKFGLIATEIPTGETFNWLDSEPWLTRRRNFNKIAPRANFIWAVLEEAVKEFKELAPSGFIEFGFSEQLLDPVFSQEPEFDFGFYGLHVSPHRAKVLEHLKEHFSITMPDRFLIGRELNKFIATFKVGICLKHMPRWPVVSPTRISRLLHAKRGIAAEYAPVPTGPSAFAAIAKKDQDFAEFCLECIRGPWKQRAEQSYEGFRAALPMKDIMERLLDETVAKSSLSAGANTPAAEDDGVRDRIQFQAPEPQLVESRGEFNFVHYRDRVYAIRQNVGPLDVAVEAPTLVERFGPDIVVVAETIEEARARVEALSNPELNED